MYTLKKSDLSKASVILGQSFNNYPIFKYIIPDSGYRKDKLQYLCHFLLRLGIAKGEVIGPSDKVEGVSIWFHSSVLKNSGLDAIYAGLLSLFLYLNPKTIGRFIEVGKFKGRMRSKIIQEPYYLCDMIGVDPIHQRKGYGRKMIEDKLSELDNKIIPCYLETSESENVAYYERLGFSHIHNYQIHDVGIFCLKRDSNH